MRTDHLCARACIDACMCAEGEIKGHFGKCWGQGAQSTVSNRSKSTSGAPRLDDMLPKWTSAGVFPAEIRCRGGGEGSHAEIGPVGGDNRGG